MANVVVYRENDKRCLILKRSISEKVHPGKWCEPGGKMEWNQLPINKPTRLNGDVLDYENSIEELLAREVLEEANVIISRNIKYINSVAFIRPDEIPVVLVKFAAIYQSGEAKPETGVFDELAWVNATEIKNYDCILGIPQEIEQTINLFKK